MVRLRGWSALGWTLLLLLGTSTKAHARADQALLDEYKAAYPEWFAVKPQGRVQPMAVPDIFGPGAVLNVGNVYMKVTNYAIIGNPFPNLSTDPSGQWEGASGIEYLAFILLGVGGVNPIEPDLASRRRVSLQAEWRPQTLDPIDRMYKSYDGQVHGSRGVDDDEDVPKHDPLDAQQWVDEDFQDGRDNDGDGLIDEDYAALGQEMWSCVIWDNTAAALAATFNEKHVPLNLECRQTAFAYSVPGFKDFNAITWTIFNRSGHGIDSMYVGLRWDMDAGPVDSPTYFNDDVDLPFFPHGDFVVSLDPNSKWGGKMDPKGYRRQLPHVANFSVPDDSAMCPRLTLRVNGFSIADNDGDEGKTTGIPSILLLGHTTDPLGFAAPAKVGWAGFRSFIAGTPYSAGGNPAVDQQRYEMFSTPQNVDPVTGFINAVPLDQQGDIQGWAWVGPFGNSGHSVPDGGSFEVTIAFAVQLGRLEIANQYLTDYDRYVNGSMSTDDLFEKYPVLQNAFAAQVAYEGVYDDPPSVLNDDQHINTPDYHGRETRLRAPKGFILNAGDCRDEGSLRPIDEFHYTWFDFDCNYCTGVFVSSGSGAGGKMLKRWNTAAPPPNPNLNVAAGYNFSSNPNRKVAPGQDGAIVLAWDNLSEITVDPEKGDFDFRSYRLWKVSNWQRPVGSSGPADNEWAMLAHFRYFDYADSNKEQFSNSEMHRRAFKGAALDSVARGLAVCPQIYIPNLSVQTIVCAKSRFATEGAASGYVQAAGFKFQGNMTEDATSWRYRQSEGECKPGSFRTVGLDSLGGVLAEVCLNPLAQTQGFTVPICLYRGDLWDKQSGEILRPRPDHCPQRAADGTCLSDTISCNKDASGNCISFPGRMVGSAVQTSRISYPVGRYQYIDREVKNGFAYFYSVTAGDSTQTTFNAVELTGRRSGVEADAVVPQVAARSTNGGVWVVPNPYRGYGDISRRPSAWDLTPNATDPTGTHIDFFGMPTGAWTIKIYTVSGDLVQTIRSTDSVNESVRPPATVVNPNFDPNRPEDPVTNPRTIIVPGYNRQQDNPNDGQARWNLISRNGQDIVSGIYLFVVESSQGSQRGKFVVIR